MKSTQTDHNMNFDGMEMIAPKQGSKFRGNQYSGKQDPNRTINKGRGPTRGNDGSCHHAGFAASTCGPITDGVPALPAQGSVRDNINRGAQVRTPGGTRAFDPSATQNYKGNSDKINVGRGPTKGNQC
jgi:hypothetical protein